MARTKKPKLKYILQVNDNVYEFMNKNAMDMFIKELQVKDYSFDIVELN